jgi:hypothetical protein
VTLRYAGGLAVALLLVVPASAGAEWYFKPFIGVTFAPSTNLVGDLEGAAGLPQLGEESGSANLVFGGSVVLLGEVFGIEGEFAHAPGFYQRGEDDQPPIGILPTPRGDLVLSSSAQTFTGSVIIAVPRRIAQYSLRPYFVGGGGVMRLRSVDGRGPVSGLFAINETLAAIDVGGGVNGFFNERVGVGWDLRYLRSVGGTAGDPAVTIDGLAARQSFWRANMALVQRY